MLFSSTCIIRVIFHKSYKSHLTPGPPPLTSESMRINPKLDETSVPFRERLFCSVADAVTASGIGRSTLYTRMKQGALEFQKHGKRTLVSVPSLMKLLNVA